VDSTRCPALDAAGYSQFTVSFPDSEFDYDAVCCQVFWVFGCNSLVLDDVTVSVYDAPGGNLLARKVTGQAGTVAMMWYGPDPPCSVYVTAEYPGGRYLAFSQSMTLSKGGTTMITLAVAPGYTCCAGFLKIPLKDTMFLTDSNGKTTPIQFWAGRPDLGRFNVYSTGPVSAITGYNAPEVNGCKAPIINTVNVPVTVKFDCQYVTISWCCAVNPGHGTLPTSCVDISGDSPPIRTCGGCTTVALCGCGFIPIQTSDPDDPRLRRPRGHHRNIPSHTGTAEPCARTLRDHRMTESQKTLFEKWLESDSPVERAHARNRLAMPDSEGVQASSPPWFPPPGDDAARAAALIAQFPPEHSVRVGGCCGG
jgi:hypothetical protein